MATADKSKVYTLADLKKHSTPSSLWLAIDGKVVDVTQFLESHPGGYDILLSVSGARWG